MDGAPALALPQLPHSGVGGSYRILSNSVSWLDEGSLTASSIFRLDLFTSARIHDHSKSPAKRLRFLCASQACRRPSWSCRSGPVTPPKDPLTAVAARVPRSRIARGLIVAVMPDV